MKFYPRRSQSEAIDFILEHEACGIFFDTGSGKTATILTALAILLHDYFKISKILVITSKVLIENVWIHEIKKWDHLQNLRYSVVMGREEEKRLACEKSADIYVTNYENLEWMMKYDMGSFDTLILDDFHRCKNERGNLFKKIVGIRSCVKRVVGLLTAINETIDIWSFCYILDGGKRLGKSKAGFCERYFFNEWRLIDGNYQLCREEKRGAKEAIYGEIKDIFFQCKTTESANTCIYKDVCIEMSPNEYSKYYWLEHRVKKDRGCKKRKYSIETISILQQAANGIWIDSDDEKIVYHKRKLSALDLILKNAKGKRVLVSSWFVKDRENILKQYPRTLVLDSVENVNKWNRGEAEMGVINPASNEAKLYLGKGTDVLVWYSLPWSYEIYKRMNARVVDHEKKKVIVHIIMMATIEEKMLLLLNNKKLKQEEMTKCLNEISEETYDE